MRSHKQSARSGGGVPGGLESGGLHDHVPLKMTAPIVGRTTPPLQYADSSDSEGEQWHDAADASPSRDIEAQAPSSSPINHATQVQSLKVGTSQNRPLKSLDMLKQRLASFRGSE
jgi:hypothetical protein